MKLYWALGASLLTHLLFVQIARLMPVPEPVIASESIEFVVVPDDQLPKVDPNAQQIVRQAIAPEKLRVKEETHPARFKSEQTQRVSEESQAQLDGLTENRSPSKALSQKPEPKEQNQKQQQNGEVATQKNPLSFESSSTEARLQEWQNLSGSSNNPGFSTRGERLPDDIKVGSFTALNTDQYLFYTFYARVEELVRFRWTSNVMRSRDLFPASLAAQYPQRSNWNTEVLFKLNARGQLVSAILLKESGYPGFDMAAIQAFKDAATFPNPPPEMKKPDGLIHLVYGFTVRFQPRFLSKETQN